MIKVNEFWAQNYIQHMELGFFAKYFNAQLEGKKRKTKKKNMQTKWKNEKIHIEIKILFFRSPLCTMTST